MQLLAGFLGVLVAFDRDRQALERILLTCLETIGVVEHGERPAKTPPAPDIGGAARQIDGDVEHVPAAGARPSRTVHRSECSGLLEWKNARSDR